MSIGRGFHFLEIICQKLIFLCDIQAQYLMAKFWSFQKTDACEDTEQSKSMCIEVLKMAFLQ